MLDGYESSEREAGGVSRSEEAGTWAAGDDGGWCVEMGLGVVRSTSILQAATAATAAIQLQQPQHASSTSFLDIMSLAATVSGGTHVSALADIFCWVLRYLTLGSKISSEHTFL